MLVTDGRALLKLPTILSIDAVQLPVFDIRQISSLRSEVDLFRLGTGRWMIAGAFSL